MKTVIYSDQRNGFLPGVEYRNPRFFQKPLGTPEEVRVIGDYPHIAQAYRALGTRVSTDGADVDIGKMRKAELIDLMRANGIEPEAGATVAQLRDALNTVVLGHGR